MAEPGGMDAGSVSVRLAGDFSQKEFDKFDRAVDNAERRKKVETALGGDFDPTAFQQYEKAMADASAKAKRKDAFKAALAGEFDARAFNKMEREMAKARASASREVKANLTADFDGRPFARFRAAVQDADTPLGKLTRRMGQANQATTFFSRALAVIKWPAFIAAAGVATSAVGALTGGVFALTGALAPLAGAPVALLAIGTAAKQAQGVAKLAFMGVGEAVGGLNEKLDKSSDAYKNLTPAAQKFVRTLETFKGPVKELQKVAQAGLFPGAEKGLTSLMQNLPAVRKVVEVTSKALGDLAAKAGKQFGSAAWGKDIEIQGARNAKTISRLGEVGLNLANAFRHVLLAAGPLVDWMTKLGVSWSKSIEGAAKTGRETGKLQALFEKTRWTMEKLGSMTGHFAKALWEIGKAGAPLGRTILKDLDKAAGRFEDWTKSASGKNQIADYFKAMKAPLYATAGLLADIVKAFTRLSASEGGRKGFLATVGAIRKDLLPVLENVIESTTRAFGPALVKLLTNLLRILGNLAGSSGPLVGFVKVLGFAAGALASLLENNPGLKDMVVFIGGIAAVAKTIQFLSMITGLKTVIGLYKSLKTHAIAAGLAQGAAGAGGTAAAVTQGAGSMFAGGAAVASATTGFKGLMAKLGPIAKKAGWVGLGLSVLGGLKEAFNDKGNVKSVGDYVYKFFEGLDFTGILPKFEEFSPERKTVAKNFLEAVRKGGMSIREEFAKLKKDKDMGGLRRFGEEMRQLSKMFKPGPLRSALQSVGREADKAAARLNKPLEFGLKLAQALRAGGGKVTGAVKDILNKLDDLAPGARKRARNAGLAMIRQLRKDGVLSADEARIAREAIFKKYDTLVDGTRSRMKRAGKNMANAMVAIHTAMMAGLIRNLEDWDAASRKLGLPEPSKAPKLRGGNTRPPAQGPFQHPDAGWHGGLVTPTGIVRGYADGGMVRDPRDTVPAWLASGEGVVTQSGMGRLGARGLNALNRGVGMAAGGVVGEFALADPLDKERKKTEPVVKKVRDLLGTIPTEGKKHAEKTTKGVGDELVSGGKKWNTGIKKTTGDIVDKFDDLKKDSTKSTTSLVGAVEKKFLDLKKNAGKHASDLGKSVSSKFDGVRKDATKYTQQMFVAVTNRFEDTKRGATRQSQLMQKAVGGNFDGTRREALKHSKAVAKNTGEQMAGAKTAGAREAKGLRGAVAGSYGSMDQAVFKGITYVRRATSKALKGLGGGELKFTVDPPKGLARGGIVKADNGGWVGSEGERGADTELYLLGRGEAVLNHHQQEVVNSMLGNFGVGLNDVIGQIDRPHYAARGKAPKRAAGGYVQGAVPPGGAAAKNLAQQMFAKGFSVTSAYRPSGTYHGAGPGSGLGDALDFGDSVNDLGQVWGALYPRRSQLVELLGPTSMPGGPSLYNGSPGPFVTGHHDHVHAAIVNALQGALGNGSGALGAVWPTIKKLSVKGTGPLKEMAQLALNKVTGQANEYGSKKAGSLSGGPGGTVNSAGARSVREAVENIAKAKGWNVADWWNLIIGEGGPEPSRYNMEGSGAFGIGQFLPMNYGKYGPGSDPAQNPTGVQQVEAMAQYIMSRPDYGNPTKAWQLWQSRSPHWYAGGGIAGMKRAGNKMIRAATGKFAHYDEGPGRSTELERRKGTRWDRMLRAANRVDRSGMGYKYGGGHGQDPVTLSENLDCSSAVSYLVQQGGYDKPTAATSAIPGWGFPRGTGKVTLFNKAHGGDAHVFARLGRRYWGTSGFARGSSHGAGWWNQDPTSSYLSGFQTYHLPEPYKGGITRRKQAGGPGGGDRGERSPAKKVEAIKSKLPRALKKLLVEPPGQWLLGENGLPYFDYAKKGLADWRPTLGQLMNSDIPGSYIKGSRDDPKRKPGPIGYVGDAIAQGTLGAFRNMMSRRVYGDTKKGRTSTSSLSALRGMKDQNFDGYVFDVGTKDASASEMLGNVKAADRITGDRPVVVPTLHGGPKRKEKNQALRAWERSHEDRKVDDLHVLDWSSGPKGTKDEKGSELTPRGYRSRAGAVAKRMRSAIRMGDTRKKGRGLVTDIYSPKGRPLTAAGGKKGGAKPKRKAPRGVNRFKASLNATLAGLSGDWGLDAVGAKLTDLDREYDNEERRYEVDIGIEDFVIPAKVDAAGKVTEDPKLNRAALDAKQRSIGKLIGFREQMVKVTEDAIAMTQKTIEMLRKAIAKIRKARDAAKSKDRPAYNQLIKDYNRGIGTLKGAKKDLYQMRFDETMDLKELTKESAAFSDSSQQALVDTAIAEAHPPADADTGADAGGDTGLSAADVAEQAKQMFMAFTQNRMSLFGAFGSNFQAEAPGLDVGTVAAGFRSFGAFGQVTGSNPSGAGGGYDAVNRAGGGPKVQVTQHFAAPPLDAHTWTADLKHEVQAQL